MTKRIGIVVSGGPAPGINGVISSVVLAASNEGIECIGFVRGFEGACSGDPASVLSLTPAIATQIFDRGGSVLGTSRFDPLKDEDRQKRFESSIERNGISQLVVIGGDGTAYVAYQLSLAYPDLRIAHIPKTIDNDLILPNQHPSFGFETARYVGTEIIRTLIIDSKTCNRWFIVKSMGRNAGFLALGLGIASGATMTLIPEEFAGKRVSVSEIEDIIFRSIAARYNQGKPYGLAIIAEGVLDRIDPDTSSTIKNCRRDDLGRLVYSDLELTDVIVPGLRKRCAEADYPMKITPENTGYELRCHPPVSFDLEYTKFLGFGAVELLGKGLSGITVTRNFDALGYQTFDEMLDENGKIKSRTVDLDSDLYRVARSFMIRP